MDLSGFYLQINAVIGKDTWKPFCDPLHSDYGLDHKLS
jgi:hypothetical protein